MRETYYITYNDTPLCNCAILINTYGITCAQGTLPLADWAIMQLCKLNPEVNKEAFKIIKGTCPQFIKEQDYDECRYSTKY